MSKKLIMALGMTLVAIPVSAQDVNRECRGVAAGVIASMRANEELVGDDMTQAAIIAARRACAAAMEGFSSDEMAEATTATETSPTETKEKSSISVWDVLSQEQEQNPGHKRIKRLRN